MSKVYLGGQVKLVQETEDKSGKTLALPGLKEEASEEGIVAVRDALQGLTDLPYNKTVLEAKYEIQ